MYCLKSTAHAFSRLVQVEKMAKTEKRSNESFWNIHTETDTSASWRLSAYGVYLLCLTKFKTLFVVSMQYACTSGQIVSSLYSFVMRTWESGREGEKIKARIFPLFYTTLCFPNAQIYVESTLQLSTPFDTLLNYFRYLYGAKFCV